MNNRISYYVSKKNPLVWLAALAMICSAVVRIANICGKGADTQTVWLQIVLPVAAALVYALVLFVGGKEHIYRTAVPVFAFAVYFGIKISMTQMWLRYVLLCWIAYMAFFVVYTVIISGKRHAWLLPIMHTIGLAVLVYECRSADMTVIYACLPDMLVLLGGVLTTLSLRIHLDGKYHPTWGDRPDGRRLRTLDPMAVVGTYFMVQRNESNNSIQDSVEISAMERYIREKRKQGLTSFGITHVFLAAYVRCIAKYPAVNRFLSGQRAYSRDNDIQFCMTIKEEMSTDGAESNIKLHLTPTDTAEDIYYKLDAEVKRIKAQAEASDFDKTVKILSFIPGLVFKFVIWLLKLLDYFGLLPKFLLEVSPFHGSIYFTSMGSLGIRPIVHHLYDFGNLPVFCAFGCKRRVNEVEADGTVVQKKYIDYTFNTDERICDGFYFATVLKHLKRLLANPERLDEAPECVVRDVD